MKSSPLPSEVSSGYTQSWVQPLPSPSSVRRSAVSAAKFPAALSSLTQRCLLGLKNLSGRVLRKTRPWSVLALLGAGATASGQIVFRNTIHQDSQDRTWTISDLENTNPTTSSNASATGLLSSAGSGDLTGHSISIHGKAVYGWNSTTALSHADGSDSSLTFAEYLNSLSAAYINGVGGGDFGIDKKGAAPDSHGSRFTNQDEAIIFTFDTPGFDVRSRIKLQGFDFQSFAQAGRFDVFLFDASEGPLVGGVPEGKVSIVYQDRNTKTPFRGNFSIDSGDKLIIATSLTNTSKYRFSRMTLDVVTKEGPGFPNVYQEIIPNDVRFFSGSTTSSATTNNALLFAGLTDPRDDNIRTVVMDMHRGYLVQESRGGTFFYPYEEPPSIESDPATATRSSNSNVRMVFDVSDPTDPTEVARAHKSRVGHMHLAYMMPPDFRVNHEGDEWFNMEDMLNINSQNPLQPDDSPYSFPRYGVRAAYVTPFYFQVDEMRDVRGSNPYIPLNQHTFGGGLPVPIGNLLIIAPVRGASRSIATYDISDPNNPVLLDTLVSGDPRWNQAGDSPGYEPAVFGHYLALHNAIGPRGGSNDDVEFVDFSDPSNLRVHPQKMSSLVGTPRYSQYKDNLMFLGRGVYDMSMISGEDLNGDGDFDDPGETAPSYTRIDVFPESDSEYMLPVGNLLFSAENTEQGGHHFSAFAFQAEPDSNPPTVAYHLPADGAVYQAVTSRIAVIVHEVLDMTTIDTETYCVRPWDSVASDWGAPIEGVIVASDKDILTFSPTSDLQPNTLYQVKVEGICDIAGNAMEAYTFEFTTDSATPLPLPQASRDDITIQDGGMNEVTAANPGSPVNLSISNITTGSGSAAEYFWDFGDGSTSGDWSTSASVQHTFATVGRRAVTLHIRDSAATHKVSTVSFTITIIESIVPGTASNHSSQIAYDEANDIIWCVNPDNNSVGAIEDSTGTQVAYEYDLIYGTVPNQEFGLDPRSLAQAADGKIWVVCHDSEDLWIIDPVADTTSKVLQFDWGKGPHDIVFNTAGNYAFVSLKNSGEVARIDVSNPSAAPEIYKAMDLRKPVALAYLESNDSLLVNQFVSPDGQGEVYSLAGVSGGSFLPTESIFALAADDQTIDATDAARGVPNYLAAIAVNPFGSMAYVGSKKDNIFAGDFEDFDGDPNEFGLSLSPVTTVRALVSPIQLSGSPPYFSSPQDIDNSSQPSAAVFSPAGDLLFVALQGNDKVIVMDAFDGSIVSTLELFTAAEKDMDPFGKVAAPQGLCYDAANNRLLVKGLLDRSVSIFDVDGFKVGNFSSPAKQTVLTVGGTDALDGSELRGKKIFYSAADFMNDNHYISCAVCHLDGGEDGRVWDFTQRGEGLRNNLDLRGKAGMGQGNVHWSANFDEIQDFDLDVINHFGGDGIIFTDTGSGDPVGPLVTPGNTGRSSALDDLAAYVASLDADTIPLSPHRTASGQLSVAAVDGQAVFTAQNCATCHDPATNYTNSGGPTDMEDVGTYNLASSGSSLASGVDTPTLLGIHATAPYFHDGRAATLEDVFDPAYSAAGQEHDLSGIPAGDRADLIQYLKEVDGTVVADVDDYRLRYTLNGDVLEETGNGSGTPSALNGPTFTSGVLGQAIDLDGTTQWVEVPNDDDINLGTRQKHTVSLWFLADDTNGTQMIYEQGGTYRGISIYLDGSTLNAGGWNRKTGWKGTWITETVTAGVWNHVVLTLDADYSNSLVPDALRVYVNGSLVGSAAGSQLNQNKGQNGIGSVNGKTRLTASTTATSNLHFDGLIDDVRIYDRALLATEVSNVYHFAVTNP